MDKSDIDKIDVDLLIPEVRKRPVIWDKDSEEYKETKNKKSCWVDIARSIFTNFNTLSEQEQEFYGQKIMLKWKNIRDTFMKCIKTRYTPTTHRKRRKYIFADQLSFLMEKGAAASKASYENHEIQEDEVEDISLVCSANVDLAYSQSMNTPSFTWVYDSAEGKLIDASNEQFKTDEDSAFFASLLPSLQALDFEQKAEFRSEVLDILKRVLPKRSTTFGYDRYQDRIDNQERFYNFQSASEDTDENVLKLLPDLGIVKTEPIDPDDTSMGATSTNIIAPTGMTSTAILPDIPALTDVMASPSSILPDSPASESITTTASAIVPDIPVSTSDPTSPSAVLPDVSDIATTRGSAANDSAKRAKLKRPPTEFFENRNGFLEATPSAPENRDELVVFGEFVSTKLRNFKDRRNQLIAQNRITSILIELEMKDLEESTATNGSSTS